MKNFEEILENEHTLDPKNWEEMRALGHRMIDDMMDYLAGIREKPVWQPTTQQVRNNFLKPLPKEGNSVNAIYQDFKQTILPYNKGNVHPRFFSWVEGGGTPLAMLADMLAAGMNANVTIGDHAPMYVDKQVINWLKEIMNYPETASGHLVSGASNANITALIVAKNNFQEGIIKQKGLQNIDNKLVIYCSAETHNCVTKAAEVIGLGYENVRNITVNADFTINTTALKTEIEKDKANGFTPFCLVGNAGTVNTAAIDDLHELLKIARAETMWFHVDGAVGAFAKLVPEYSQQLQPIEEADSVALDLHKWLYVPYEIACVLIKDAKKHRFAFAPAKAASYLAAHERGLAAGPDPIANYGMELSRNFKALKVWMSLQEHGVGKYQTLIRQNIAQAFYTANLIEKNENLEMLTPVKMNIVCFRFIDKSLNNSDLNTINKEILMQLHEQGIAAPSYTFLNGNYAIRAAITNHRTRKEDLHQMLDGVVAIGKSLLKK